jgi:hypothetical protein
MFSLSSLSSLLKQWPLLLGMGWVLAPVIRFVERFLWSDWEFAGFLGVLVALDTIAALINAWRHADVSVRLIDDLLLKLFAYSATLITTHTLSHYTVHGEPNSLLGELVPYFDAVVYAAILSREALSLHEELRQMGYPLLPPFLLRRLRDVRAAGSEAAAAPPPKGAPPPRSQAPPARRKR